MSDKITEFTIDRKTWWRGEGTAGSRLLRSSDGMMCCLGHYGLACGLSAQDILDIAEPFNLTEQDIQVPLPMQWLIAEEIETNEEESPFVN